MRESRIIVRLQTFHAIHDASKVWVIGLGRCDLQHSYACSQYSVRYWLSGKR